MSADLGARNEAEPLSLYRLCLFQIGFSCCMKHHLLISTVMGYCHHSLILSLLSKGNSRTIQSCKGRESWYVDTAFLFKEPIGAIFKFYPLLTYTRKWFGWWKGLHVRPLIDIRIRWRSCLFVVSPFPLHRAGFSSHQFLIREVSHSRSFQFWSIVASVVEKEYQSMAFEMSTVCHAQFALLGLHISLLTVRCFWCYWLFLQ